MLLKDKKIAIAGAGPVGLLMAKLLQQSGADVIVYERDKNAETRIWGGTLDLHKSTGQEAMKKAGLLTSYYEKAVPIGRTIVDEKGSVLFKKIISIEDKNNNLEINRNNLRSLLLASLAADTVIWDSKLIELNAKDGKWKLNFGNGKTASADFVIGANGDMSNLRKYVTDAKVEHTGTFIIQGDVVEPEKNCSKFYQLCDNTILMSAKEGNLLVANPKNNGLLSYSVFFKTPEEFHESRLNFQDKDSIVAFLLKKFSGWDTCYKELFSSTSFFAGLPTRKLALNISWKGNRPLPITLIGDAAHIMPPFAGQGVNNWLSGCFSSI